MDSTPFVDAFQEVNSRMLGLVGSLSALRELSGVEVSNRTETEIITTSLEIIIENLDLDYVVVHAVNGAELTLQASIGWDLMDDEHINYHQELVNTLATYVIEHRDEYNNSITDNCEAGAFIGLPLMANNEIIAVLSACHPHQNFFTLEHQRSIGVFCNFLAQAIITHRQIQDMQNQIDERTRQLEFALEEALSLKERYEALAIVDELTGLHNRRFFFPESRAVLSRTIRYAEPFSLLIVDIEGSQAINEQYDNDTGDSVLMGVAYLLKEQARESDIVARMDGSVFILALPVTEFQGAEALVKRIHEKLADIEWMAGDDIFTVKVNTGITEYRPGTEKDTKVLMQEMLKQVYAELNHNKQQAAESGQSRSL